MSNNLGRKGKNCETIPSIFSQNLFPSSNGTGQRSRTTTLLFHRTTKPLLSKKCRCFLCRCFGTHNIQPIMAPHPAFRFSTEETKFPFAITGLDFFVLFYIEDKQKQLEKWTYCYMPRYKSSPLVNMSRFKSRHLSQCISMVHMPKMSTYFFVQR